MTAITLAHQLTAARYMDDARAAKAKGRPAVAAHYVKQARHYARLARGRGIAPMPWEG